MAKKKSKSNISIPSEQIPSANVPTSKEDSMVAKLEVRKSEDQEKVSRVVGTIFILVGIVLIGFGIYSFIRYSSTPELDESFNPPVISDIDSITNKDTITVKGFAEGYDEVVIYVNSSEAGKTKVLEEGNFEYSYKVTSAGTYLVSVAGLNGFPKRHISKNSESKEVIIDWSAPSLATIDFPTEVGTETVTVKGIAEADAVVTVKRGTDQYSITCDKDGAFTVRGIVLEEGPNLFNVEIKDVAGNVTKLQNKINITYSPDSDVNGNGTDTSIPVAAGELEEALDTVFGNNLMLIFGLLAVFGFAGSLSFMFWKKKQEA